MQIILKIEELDVRKSFSKAGVRASPVADLLVGVQLENGEHYNSESGVLNTEGLRELLKQVNYCLYFTSDDDNDDDNNSSY